MRAREINEEMKQAAARALAERARADGLSRDGIVPSPFDPLLIETVAPAVAKAACETGAARKPLTDWDAYRERLKSMKG